MFNLWGMKNLTHNNRDGDRYLSPSQLTSSVASWFFKYCYLNERRRDIIVGEAAALGSSVHSGIQSILCESTELEAAQRSAQFDFDLHPANKDDVKRAKYRETIPQMIANGVDALTEAGFLGSKSEVKINCTLEGVKFPVIGFVDLVVPETMFCEIKTKGHRKTKLLKDGSQGWSKPTLPKTVEYTHLLQCAIYHHALKITPSVLYVAEHDCVLYTPFNCDDLKADSLAAALEEMRQRAILRQNLLNYSTDPKKLAAIIDPDWKHNYQWDINPDLLEEAKKLWQQ